MAISTPPAYDASLADHGFEAKELKGLTYPLGLGPLKSTFAASKWQRYLSKMAAAGSHSACKGILL